MSFNSDFISELKKNFIGDIRLDLASRVLYSTDASIYQIEPLGVAIPRTQDDLQAAVELASKHKVPILPRGAGSSLGGQAIGEALILDCSRWLDSIIEIDTVSHTATVEPGVVLSNLNRASAKHGLMFGPDPASAERATMGGVIGNNATGAHSILYGMSADHLISTDVILGDGTLETWDENNQSLLRGAINEIREKYSEAIKSKFPKTWRNSAGYRLNYLLPWSPSIPSQWDVNHYGLATTAYRPQSRVNLASLLAGSEGTLAVMRRARVNLVPRPKHTILGVLAYHNISDACDDIPRLLEFNPSAIELIPDMILRLAHSVPEYARQVGWIVGDPAAVLVVEFSGDRSEVLKEALRKIGDLLVVAETAEEQARVWNVRKMGLGILDSRPQSARPAAFIEDCAIPVERLGEFVREIEKILVAHNTVGGIYAHASAGCLHIRPILDLQHVEGVKALRSIGEQVLALTLRLDGSMSSEHGDGIVAGEWIEKTYGAEVTDAMRLLKRSADPNNLLNPNKLFDAPPMDTHLRFGVNFSTHEWTPSIDFTRNGGLGTAIEQCNGQGVCRKDTGVMCPSFQATREEQNSTRGRANLLRAFIANSSLVIHHSDLEDSVAKALDLCLACKGCTAECPSGVDMAKLKFAFLAEYHRTHRRPFRDYIFGYFHVLTALLSSIAPLANFLMQNRMTKRIITRVLQVTSNRPFPEFTNHRARHQNHKMIDDSNTLRERVLFLTDPFSRYIEPDVEQAAFDVLNKIGYEVIILPIVSAGASLLSKGFLDEAHRHAERVLRALKKIDPEGALPIVGIEPPEIYSLKNDYQDLLPDRLDELIPRLKNAWLLEEFLIRSKELQDLRIANKDNNNLSVYFHPHCHQRAEGPAEDGLPNGLQATIELLRMCGYEIELIEGGCCGMAGTFGYEAEHYELSMQVGELAVLPKIRQVRKDSAGFVSTGAACRMQIAQGTGVLVEHPIVLAACVICSETTV